MLRSFELFNRKEADRWYSAKTCWVKFNEFGVKDNHINGIESFWSFAKRRMVKFNGIAHHTFYLHLKETEFRFNHRKEDLYKSLLRLFRDNPI